MNNDHQKRCLIKLVQNLRDNKENNRKNVTLLLGAGCSLSSTDKNITTNGIVRDLVSRYACEGETIPESWSSLYTQFVNNVWNGQGNADKIHLLENYFNNMKPSIGYEHVRVLIEEKYINNVITTNFDPMLDTVFKELSYNYQVGTTKMVVGNDPQFTLLKAHGDLKIGQLRFSPSELYKLPDEIESVIKSLTNAILIIVGYRGQDMGMIQALSDSEDHCVYWITYDKPDYYNEYENGPIIDLLKKRNSENNLLDGPEYGDFDTIFTKISLMLHDNSLPQENQLYKLWKKSFIGDYLTLNLRFEKLFINMLNILEHFLAEFPWRSCSLYYADSHNKLTASIIEILNEKVFPAEILYYISNEVDGLLFALSVEIWCMCQGYSITNIDLVQLLKTNYAKHQENLDINQDFWDALAWLSNMPISGVPLPSKPYYEIVISFDKGKNLQMILKRVSIMEFATMFLLLQRILLFTKTSGQGNDVIGINYKKTLENYLYQILSCDNNIDIQLNQMPLNEYQEIYNNLLHRYFSEKIIQNRRILYFEKLYIQVNLVEPSIKVTMGIFDDLILKSQQMKATFVGDFANTEFVWNRTYEMIQEFLHSESNGLFISGDSGIGKTWMIKNFLLDSSFEEYVFFPISAKQIEQGVNIFALILGEDLISPDSIQHINMIVKMRQQKIVLIIDGINEMDAPLQQTLSLYKDIIEFCDFLSKERLDSIQIIVTCRTEFCHQIQNSIYTMPSPSSFFSMIDDKGDSSTVYYVPPLSDEDVTQFVNMYSFCEKKDIDMLKQKFGKIIYNPLYLNIICKIADEKIAEQKTSNEISLYKLWFRNIENSAMTQQISPKHLVAMLDYVIFDKYFCTSEEILTTSKLFMYMTTKDRHVSTTFEWLVQNDIFQRPQTSRNLVLFCHDKIEGFFLIQYIQERYSWNLYNAFSDITIIQQNSSVVKDSIFALLNLLQSTNLSDFKTYMVTLISEDNTWLVNITAGFLIEGGKYILNVLNSIEQFISRSSLEKFVSVLLEQMLQKINNFEVFPSDSIKGINNYIQQSVIVSNPFLLASNYYNYAKYIWTFPSDESDMEYEFAIKLCDKINKINSDCLPHKLIDNNNQLLAVLLRNKGKLNDAIYLMEKVYQNLYEYALFNEACLALLDLGAMYRELTWFDKALQIYQEYPIELVTDSILIHRLYMNIGIIYKNKVQNDLFNKSVSVKLTYENYFKSRELFEKVYDYAQEINHIPLLLEIIAELIESTVAGYYLNITNISTAIAYAEEMDIILPKYPVPIRRIQSCRMWARVLTLQGEALEAIKKLREGFQIARHYNIPFRAADCCNQISGIICDNINSNLITRELLIEGIEACQYSISYYTELQQSEHVYLADSRKKLKILQHALEDML